MRIAIMLAGMLLAGTASARDTLSLAHESNGPAIIHAGRTAEPGLHREHDQRPTPALDLVAENRAGEAALSGRRLR